jgi:hypothetical protein
VETPLTPMPLNRRAVRRAATAIGASTALRLPSLRLSRPPACLEGAGPATSPLRCSVARGAQGDALGETPHGTFPGGTFVPDNDVTGRFGAGVEPATAELLVRCSTHLSYPVVTCRIRTGGLRLSPLLSQAELTSLRETPSRVLRHTPRQCCAHRTSAVCKLRTRAAEKRPIDGPHWRLVKDANSCATASACRPCRSIQAQR